jgi:hypothetical protein
MYLRKRAQGNAILVFALLVDAIGHGNNKYIKDLCTLLGHPRDMARVATLIANEMPREL